MDADDFVRVVEKLAETKFAAIELPLSCPHTPGFGLLAGQGTPESTKKIVSAIRKITKLPIFVKLSPNIPGIGDLAKAAEDAGASAITAVNTLGPGMIINIEARKPVLSYKVGGVSGNALRPIATRCVYDIYESVKIPIIGVGGISTGRHALEMMIQRPLCSTIHLITRQVNSQWSGCRELMKNLLQYHTMVTISLVSRCLQEASLQNTCTA
jgi:dihydroorotate dehydrogenase (NAD+) catalytic subunit